MALLRDLSLFWTMFHVIFLFLILFRSKHSKRKTMLLALIAMTVLMTINGVGIVILGVELMGKLLILTCTIPSLVFFYILSADKNLKYLFTFCVADTVALWILGATNILDYYFGKEQYILMFILRLIAFPLLEYGAYKYLRKPYLELQDNVDKGWGVFTGLTITYYILLWLALSYPSNISNRPEYMPTCVLILFLMFFTYATMFTAMHRQLLLYRKQRAEQMLQEQKYSLETQLSNQQHIRKMKHDMRGHMVTLSGLLASGKTGEAMQYLKSVESVIGGSPEQVCANPYLNAVLSHYVYKFKELDAAFKTEIQIGEEELPYMELCRILSNGLENAYNGSKEVAADKRQISVQMKYSKDYLIIRIKNNCKPGLTVVKGVLPVSGRKGSEHGFGLLSIKEVAEELGGDMLCYTDNGCFILDVIVRLYAKVKM